MGLGGGGGATPLNATPFNFSNYNTVGRNTDQPATVNHYIKTTNAIAALSRWGSSTFVLP